MSITYAKEVIGFDGILTSYDAIKDGINMSIPNDMMNRDYIQLMEEVEAGTLVITPAT